MTIAVTASGGTGNNLGVYNEGASSPTMSDMSITASGGTNNRGVHNWISSSPTMSDMSITASGGTNNNGVLNHDSSSTMSDMSITAFGGSSENFGVYNRNDASYARIRKSTISASGGTNNSVVAQNGSGSKETYISDSILTGDVTGSPVCSFTFDIDGTDLTA
ncbi:MAG: hypothetical protein GY694_09040, partial [Gammaproteobacteria bacterium]|nr:hypothetical protein [Gammaproteobacteria bacterium]